MTSRTLLASKVDKALDIASRSAADAVVEDVERAFGKPFNRYTLSPKGLLGRNGGVVERHIKSRSIGTGTEAQLAFDLLVDCEGMQWVEIDQNIERGTVYVRYEGDLSVAVVKGYADARCPAGIHIDVSRWHPDDLMEP